jgi:hypothetical protein
MSSENAGGEEVPTFELGDRIYIEGGQYDRLKGRIYYMDADLIRVLPDGVSDSLKEIELVDGEPDERYKMESMYLLSKAPNPAFVAQIDAQLDQLADTFSVDGMPGLTYRIRTIHEDEDTMVLEDETGGRLELQFRSEFHRGIERSQSFAVLRPRYDPTTEAPEEDAAAALSAEGNAGNEDEYGDFVNVEIPEPAEENTGGLQLVSEENRIYPDSVQRDEMITGLLELLDQRVQKLPRRQKEIRQLSEQLLLLRNELVKYSVAGDPEGQIPTSLQTVGELLQKLDIPLARPVLDVKKSLYPLLRAADEGGEMNLETEKAVDIHDQLRGFQQEANFLATHLGGAATEAAQVPGSLPAWYLTWETFFRKYMRTFVAGEDAMGQSIVFAGDKEFFRSPAPTDESVFVDGFPKNGEKKKMYTSPQEVTSVPQTVMRGLGPREVQMKTGSVRVESGEEGVLTNQLIFPLSAERELGSTRSGSLAKDIHQSHRPFRAIRDILRELDWIPDEPVAGGVLSVGPGGNSEDGMIGIEDWLKAQPLHLKGLGDARIQLKSLGLIQRELNMDQQTVLVDKIKSFRAAIKHFIKENLEESKRQLASLRLETQTFLQEEALEEVMAVLSTEPLLAAKKDELAQRLPAYKGSEIALLAGLSAEMADLMMAALAGEPAPLARERNRRVADLFLETLRNAMKKKRKAESEGEIPTPNTCQHVKDLEIIRRVEDEREQMALLSRFLTNYKKERVGNWVICNACDRDLLCYHEELLLMEFRHPRDRDAIHKELLLGFSMGQSGGYYMCRNCGQHMAEIDYDRGMEFNEEGIPMAATAAVLEAGEEQTAEEKAMDEVLGAEEGVLPAGAGAAAAAAPAMMTDQQKMIYAVAAKIFQQVGIYPDPVALKGVLQRVDGEIGRLPSRDTYAAQAAAAARQGKKMPDYDIRTSQMIVAVTAAHVIVEIQSHIPDYVPGHTIPGCVAGFTGYPLGRLEDLTCINYISCAISGIRETKAPWGLTGFLTEGSEVRRREMISKFIQGVMGNILKTSAVQLLLTEKRAYYEKRYGSVEGAGSLVETIPPGFRPVPYAISAEDAAKQVVVPEAAGERERVQAWIQEGHKIARANGVYIKGSPYSETSCCTTLVAEPRRFWGQKDASLPSLPTKAGPAGQHDSQVMFRYSPRPIQRILASTPEDLLYRVYLKVCYDGPRKGLPHEPGYTNICIHCGFQFPESPYIETPAPPTSLDSARGKEMMKEWKAEMDAIIMRGKAALEAQKVPVSDKRNFDELLDATHNAYRVSLPGLKKPMVGRELMETLLRMEPEPFRGWRELMAQTIERVERLPPQADSTSIAEAYGPLSEYYTQCLQAIQTRMGADGATYKEALETLFEQSAPTQIAETVRTYFLVTFQRIATGFKADSFRVLNQYSLPPGVADDIHKEMQGRFSFLGTLQRSTQGYALVKVDAARKQLAACMPILQKHLRPNLVPGGAVGMRYLAGTLIAGVLADFINPNVISTTGTEGARLGGQVVDKTARLPMGILQVCLQRLRTEGLNYTQDQIKELLAKRVEAEKMAVFRRWEAMTPEEKAVNKRNQKLGLKEYAVGGTKAIYRLDEAQYERERGERAAMGIPEGFVEGDELRGAMQQFLHEENYGGGGFGAEAGYDGDDGRDFVD